MDVESAIQQLEQLIAEGRPVPLSSSVMVNRAEVEAVLTDMRTRLPDELRQSRWVIKERDDLLAQAARESEQLMADTRVERERMLSETEVVRAANREAERILTDAREHARVLRLEAEDYVDGKLANFEIVLQKTLAAVEKGRERLRGRLATDDLAPPEQPPAAGQTAADRDPSSQFYDYEQLDQRP
ncbi:MAG: ATPase [Euzebyales bacterium]|nr:ATPase [Euzebyales bacterium]